MKKTILLGCILIFIITGCTSLTTLFDNYLVKSEDEEDIVLTGIADGINERFLKYLSQETGNNITYDRLDVIYNRLELLPAQIAEEYKNANLSREEIFKVYKNVQEISNLLEWIVSYWDRERAQLTGELAKILENKYPATYRYSLLTNESFSELTNFKKKVYSDGYYSEVDLAEKEVLDQYGLKIDARINQVSCNDLLSFCHSGNYPENIIYLIGSSFKVMQTIDDGVLISHFDSYGNSYIAFLETDKQYYDEYRFSKYILGIHRGAFQYSSLTGTRTVPRLIEIELQNDYYFLFPK